MKTFFFLLTFFSFFHPNLSAQSNDERRDTIIPPANDTVVFLTDFSEDTPPSCFRKVTKSRLFRMSSIPVSLFALSGISYPFEESIRDKRNAQIPGFRYHYDDYLQYAPGAVMFGLKAAGVQGYSNWGQMLTSTAISTATMALLVNGVKYTVQKERPDGSARNSFPSGHTATAFMTATWLHTEYGQTRSPLYSVGGYTAAAIVGISRVLNNRHWVSDVLFGAGIGYLSAEIGYWAGDLIFQKKKTKIDPALY